MNQIPLARPDISQLEKQLVLDVLNSNQLSRGPMLHNFEKEFAALTKAKHAIGVSSGTSGLIMALQVLDVKPGDEVITVAYTVPATMNAILAVGAIPIFVDVECNTRGMSPDALRSAITHRTRAVIVVHAFGQSADIQTIANICNTKQIALIEDACEAPGNTYQGHALGTWGDIGVFGFYANKQITTGEGGMLLTNHSLLAEKLDKLRNNGRRMDGRWLDQDAFGINSRLNEMSAALGWGQLQRLQEIREKRHAVTRCYEKYLSSPQQFTLPKFREDESHSMWFAYVIHLNDSLAEERDFLWQSLMNDGISCGRYFSPCHWQPYYQSHFASVTLPNTESLALSGLALPFYNDLSENEIQYIAARLGFYIDQLPANQLTEFQVGS